MINDIIGDNSQVVIPDRKNKLDYLSYIQRSKFNLCPENNTHKSVGTLMLKSIPIMIKIIFKTLQIIIFRYSLTNREVDKINNNTKIIHKN